MKAILLHDASVLLNLLATDQLESVAASTGWQFAICGAVRDEAKKLRDPTTGEMVSIDISSFIRDGVLQVVELAGNAEQKLYIENVADVDDGEAMSLAIASSRQFELAIDDKVAIRFARARFPSLRLWTTPEILKLWSQKAAIPTDVLSAAIIKIETRSRYFPPQSHPLVCWWQKAKTAS